MKRALTIVGLVLSVLAWGFDAWAAGYMFGKKEYLLAAFMFIAALYMWHLVGNFIKYIKEDIKEKKDAISKNS